MTTLRILKSVSDFVNALDAKDGAVCFRYIDRLKIFGTGLRPPINEHLGGGLYTLRISGRGGEYRIFYGFHNHVAFLLHAIHKKSQKLKNQDVELAKERFAMVIKGNFLHC